MLKRLRQATQSAVQDTAVSMTNQLRQSALKSGWDKDVVANMHVQHSDGKFNVHVSPEYKDRAFVHEFGNETVRPTAVIRKFSSNTKEVQQSFMSNIKKHYGGK
jgi:hypothetical protein